MADNVTYQSTTPATPPSGVVVATDDVGGVHYQLVKVCFGALDAATLVTASVGLPVSASSLPLPSGAATEATLAALDAKVTACNTGAVVIASGSVTVSGSVSVSGSVAVTNAGTFAVQESGGVLTALQLIDDTVQSFGATAVNSGIALAGTDGVNGRMVKVDAAGELQVDVLTMPTTTVTASNLQTNLNQLGGNAISAGNGTSGTGTLRVTVASDSTGTLAVTQATASSLNAQVVGTIAHDGVDSGNPVKIGGRAVAHGSNPTAVAAADRTDLLANRHGIPFGIGGHPNVITRTARIAAADGAQTNASILTVSAGTKIVVTRVSVAASAANSVNVRAKVGFATATLAADSASGANGILVDQVCPAGGGITVGDGSGILGIGADDEDVRLTCDAPTGGHVTVTLSYFTIES